MKKFLFGNLGGQGFQQAFLVRLGNIVLMHMHSVSENMKQVWVLYEHMFCLLIT